MLDRFNYIIFLHYVHCVPAFKYRNFCYCSSNVTSAIASYLSAEYIQVRLNIINFLQSAGRKKKKEKKESI